MKLFWEHILWSAVAIVGGFGAGFWVRGVGVTAALNDIKSTITNLIPKTNVPTPPATTPTPPQA